MAFLDVCVTRQDGTFTTSVYRKATFSGVFTNFYSFISIQFKASLISTLLYTEVKRLREILAKNTYPLEFIDQCITSFLNKQYTHTKRSGTMTVEPKKSKEIVIYFL